jgi:hypothetical protein
MRHVNSAYHMAQEHKPLANLRDKARDASFRIQQFIRTRSLSALKTSFEDYHAANKQASEESVNEENIELPFTTVDDPERVRFIHLHHSISHTTYLYVRVTFCSVLLRDAHKSSAREGFMQNQSEQPSTDSKCAPSLTAITRTQVV